MNVMHKKYEIKDFLEVKSAWAPSFSPDDSKIAYLSNLTGIAQIYIIPREGGESMQLTDSEDPISFATFNPTQNVIIFSKSEGGNEQSQLYLIDPDTKEITPLTDNKNAKHDFGAWSRDGELISYSSTERNGKDFDIYVMDIKTKKSKCVYQEGGWCDAGTFSPNRTYLSIKKNYSNMNSDTYLYNFQTQKVEHLTPHTEPELQGTPRWLADESAFFLTMDKGREFMGLAKYSLDSKKFKYVFTPDWDIDDVSIQRDSKFLGITINEDGYNKIIIKSPHTLKTLPYELPRGEIVRPSFSKDAKFITFSLGDSTKTRDIWVFDMDSKKSTRVTNSPQGVPSEVMVNPKLVRYESFDGLTVPYFIYKPRNLDGKKKFPAVINIHGGPEGQYQPGFAPVTQYFVNNGYIVIAPNIRGSSGYGKTYLALDDVEKRMDSVKDIVALRDHLKTIPRDLVKRLNKSKKINKAILLRRQISLASISLRYHSEFTEKMNFLSVMNKELKKYSSVKYMKNTHMYASFGHLNGYSAMYYTYLWSRVIAQDILLPFQKNGMYDRATAGRYVEKVLMPGGSKDAEDLIKNFLGRKWNLKAFQKWLEK